MAGGGSLGERGGGARCVPCATTACGTRPRAHHPTYIVSLSSPKGNQLVSSTSKFIPYTLVAEHENLKVKQYKQYKIGLMNIFLCIMLVTKICLCGQRGECSDQQH